MIADHAMELLEALEVIESLASGIHGTQTNAKGAADNLAYKNQILAISRSAIAMARSEEAVVAA